MSDIVSYQRDLVRPASILMSLAGADLLNTPNKGCIAWLPWRCLIWPGEMPWGSIRSPETTILTLSLHVQTMKCNSGSGCPQIAPPCTCFDIPPGSDYTCAQQVRPPPALTCIMGLPPAIRGHLGIRHVLWLPAAALLSGPAHQPA